MSPPTSSRSALVRASAVLVLCGVLGRGPLADDAPDARFDCLIEPMIVTAVGSAVQGVVSEVKAHKGDLVERGDPLVYLDAETEVLNLELALMRASMRNEIVAREAELELANLELDRIERLVADDTLPGRDLDEAMAGRQLARSALQQARDNHRLMSIELDKARMQLERRIVRSPVAGLVTEQLVFEGEFVYDDPVATVAQLDPLRVDVVMPGARYGSLKPGDPVLVHRELDRASPIEATIAKVDRFLDPRSGTFDVLLLLPNADLSIVSGQNCSVEFPAVERVPGRPAAAVPDGARSG